VAKHADLWNVPGGDIDTCVERSKRLDSLCAEIGRDPGSITRSIHLPYSPEQQHLTADSSTARSTSDSGISS